MITIRKATSPTDKEKVFRLRYDIYIGEMDREQIFVDHESRQVQEPSDDTGHLYLAEDDGVPVGTVRINFRKEGDLECEELYEMERFKPFYPNRVSMTTKLMVREAYRNSSVAARLIVAVYEHARREKIQFDFIDCNPHLLRMYQKIGHRIYRTTISHPEYGTVIPMVMILDDVAYFERIGSPLRRAQSRHDNTDRGANFFNENFPDYASQLPSFAHDDRELRERWKTASESIEPDRNEAFEGLSGNEVCTVLNRMDPIDYSPGDLIVRQGEESEGVFFILQGGAEVLISRNGERQTRIQHLEKGQIFGETGLFAGARRNATVRATQDTRVLLFNRSQLGKLERSHPQIALKLLKNHFSVALRRSAGLTAISPN